MVAWVVRMVTYLFSAFMKKKEDYMALAFWKRSLAWALHTARSESQVVAIKAVNDASTALAAAVREHAPDYAPDIERLLQQVTVTAIAGISTKQLKPES